MKVNKLGIIVFLVLLGIGAVVIRGRTSGNTTDSSAVMLPFIAGGSASTPTPFPFQDMTIPHLRARKYESALGTRTPVSENANYTSYTTSYDSDGLKVNGLLTIPKGEAATGLSQKVSKRPAIVFIHGYI